MKTVWDCRCVLTPGSGGHTETFSTFSEARAAMAQRISEQFDFRPYLKELRRGKEDDCQSAADFLESFLSSLELPDSCDDIPEHSELPEHCYLRVDEDGLLWEHDSGEAPQLAARYLLEDEGPDYFVVEVFLSNPKQSKPKKLYISFAPRNIYGSSAYPIMVLNCLADEPKTQKQIVDAIQKRYNCVIDRKAVGRHIETLKALNYNIRHSEAGYYIPSPSKQLTPMEWNAVLDCVRAYPNMTDTLRESLLSKLNSIACDE